MEPEQGTLPLQAIFYYKCRVWSVILS